MIKQSNKKEKKRPLRLLWIVFLSAGVLSERYDDWTALIIILVTLLVICTAVPTVSSAVKAAKKKRERGSYDDHCHDRLHTDHAAACSDGLTHWKTQLNGFLESGLIEREEYQLLLEKYLRENGGNG